MSTSVKIRNTSSYPNPEYKTPGSAGVDLYANHQAPIDILPGQIVSVPTGVFIEIPQGMEAQIRSRSGLALEGLIVANSPGTIDSDYRGEIKVLLVNINGQQTISIKPGDRIAQMVFAPVIQVVFEEVDEGGFSQTTRGSGGFGSTGK
jgi:dUTP pyrophosphatase